LQNTGERESFLTLVGIGRGIRWGVKQGEVLPWSGHPENGSLDPRGSHALLDYLGCGFSELVVCEGVHWFGSMEPREDKGELALRHLLPEGVSARLVWADQVSENECRCVFEEFMIGEDRICGPR
jgi:hypothetical protein